jgi:uncharacterized protein (TIGR02246 family)
MKTTWHCVRLSICLLVLVSGCSQNGKELKMGAHETAGTGTPNSEQERASVQAAVAAYFSALDKSDVDDAIGAFTPDAMIALQGLETVRGTAHLRTAYADAFKALRFASTHTYDEVRIYGDEAFVRTTSGSQTTVLATGEVMSERYREFFILKKVDGRWRIDRYMNNRPSS